MHSNSLCQSSMVILGHSRFPCLSHRVGLCAGSLDHVLECLISVLVVMLTLIIALVGKLSRTGKGSIIRHAGSELSRLESK